MDSNLILPGSREYHAFRKSEEGQEILGNYTLAHRVIDAFGAVKSAASTVAGYVAPAIKPVAQTVGLTVVGGAMAVGLGGCPTESAQGQDTPKEDTKKEAAEEPGKKSEEEKKKAEAAEAEKKLEEAKKKEAAEAKKKEADPVNEALGKVGEALGKTAEEQKKAAEEREALKKKEATAAEERKKAAEERKGLQERIEGVEKEFKEEVKEKAGAIAREEAKKEAITATREHARSLLHREANKEMVKAYETLNAVLKKYEAEMVYYETKDGAVYFAPAKQDKRKRVLFQKKADLYTIVEQEIVTKKKKEKKKFKKGERLPDGTVADKDKEAEVDVEYQDWDKKSEYSFDVKTGKSHYHIVRLIQEVGVWKEKSTDYDATLLGVDVKNVLRAIAELQSREEGWKRPLAPDAAERVGYSSFEFSGEGKNKESGYLQPMESRKNHITLKGHGSMKTSTEADGTKEGGGGLISVDIGNVLELNALYNYMDMHMPNGERVFSNQGEALAAITGSWFRLLFGGKYENTIRRSIENSSETIVQGADTLNVDTTIDNWQRREGYSMLSGLDLRMGQFLLGGRFVEGLMKTNALSEAFAKIYGTVNGMPVDDFERAIVDSRTTEHTRAGIITAGVDAKDFLLLPFFGYMTRDVSNDTRTRTESGETQVITDNRLLNEYAIGAKVKAGLKPIEGAGALSTLVLNAYTNSLIDGNPLHGVGGNIAVSDVMPLISALAEADMTDKIVLGFDAGYNDGNTDVGVLFGLNLKGINRATRKQLSHYQEQKIDFRTVPWGLPGTLSRELSLTNFVNAAEAGNVILAEYLFQMNNGNPYHGGRIAVPISIGSLGSESGRNHKVVIYADLMYGLRDFATQGTLGAATTLYGGTIFAEMGFERGVNGLGPDTHSVTARGGVSFPFGAAPRKR